MEVSGTVLTAVVPAKGASPFSFEEKALGMGLIRGRFTPMDAQLISKFGGAQRSGRDRL